MRIRSLSALGLAVLFLGVTSAFAADEPGGNDVGMVRRDAHTQSMLRSAAARASGVAATVETTFVGFSTATGVTNYWSVGPGPNRPTPLTTGVWQWDQVAQVHGDSLAGWWPIRGAHVNASGPTRTDDQRPWWAIECGNVVNYVINQGDGTDPAHPGVSYKRTFGLIGEWHRDAGNLAVVPDPWGGKYPWPSRGGVNWVPLIGSYSAWMGLRQHGDLTVVDPITGNPFNEDAIAFTGTNAGGTGSNKTFPGYQQQCDQMLYRDLDVTGLSGPVTLSFRWQSAMSTGHNTTAATRTGWFEGDPLSINSPTPGNFISAEAGSPANTLCPVDSFQVYVGKPVEGTFTASTNVVMSIYDPLRRWFNEVLDKNQRLWVFGAAGNNVPTTTTITIDAPNLAALQAGGNNTLRVVFRVHTNAGTSDESTPAVYCSQGKGAVQLDDVRFNGSLIPGGDFESPTSIDNTQPASVAWRTTGKPPAIYFHVHNLATLRWADICGGLNSPIRVCNMQGNVISWGDHDNNEAAGGALGTAEEEGNWGMVSPTIGLVAVSGVPNTFGLTLEQATPTQSYTIAYDLYAGIFDLFNQGNCWQFGCMSYPALQVAGGPAAGTPQWGERRTEPGLLFTPTVSCFTDYEDMTANGEIISANGSGIARPDSIRLFIQKLQQCYRFGITTGCSPTNGAYSDNMGLAILDGVPAAISVNIWDFFNDTFPFTETAGLPGTAAFDTTSALIRTGLNLSPTTTTLFRFDVPADSVFITAPSAPTEQNRVDMVFRIKPGVGNYVTVGDPSSGLRAVPTSTAPAGPGSFWGQYLGAPATPNSGFVGITAGEFATPGAGGVLDALWPGGWNWNVWRSARCDTAEFGLFPVGARGAGDIGVAGALDANFWMSCYHESDPHYAALGVVKPKCFLIDTLGAINATNIECGTAPPWLLNPAIAARAGFDGNVSTIERTQIIPDGLLTPGAHVEYFFRKSAIATPATFEMVPDTNTVLPQPNEGPSFDAHRWQEFSVLPDRWKDVAFGGQGMACMLYIDWDDRRGDEMTWVGIADSIGATSAAKYGAHNGWHGPGGDSPNDPANFVAAHGGQAGTTWDMYGVKASESLNTCSGSIGARLSYRDPSPANLVNGKYSKLAPTPEMMAAYYKVTLMLTGDLNFGVLGPFTDRSADDIGFLEGFLQGATLGAPRGLMVQGDGFYESLAPSTFLTDFLGGDLQSFSYLNYTANATPVSDFIVSSDISPAGDIYGIRNGCTYTNDVLLVNPALTEAKAAGFYSPVGATQYVASVLKTADATRPWVALSNGFDVANLTGRFDGSSNGRLAYFYNAMKNVFGSFCSVAGTPVSVYETPANTHYVDFVRLGNNPVENRQAIVVFGLAKSDRVQINVYDVTGRRVRTLADRVFEAGEHRLTWDGVDDRGATLPHGVYFARTRYVGGGFEDARKMVILN